MGHGNLLQHITMSRMAEGHFSGCFGAWKAHSGRRHPQLSADGPSGVVVHLAVPRDRTLPSVRWVDPYGMAPALA